MHDFVSWLNSDDARRLHPIERAALAHYKLVFIHPFIDGNGRASRLLMNLVLYSAGYKMTAVPIHLITEYYDHLKTADYHDRRPFLRFIAKRVEYTIDEYHLAIASKDNLIPTIPEADSHNSDTLIILLGYSYCIYDNTDTRPISGCDNDDI